MLKLYHNWFSSNSQRVQIALCEKALRWESYRSEGELRQDAEFRSVSPHGVVPVLVHDDRVIHDSVVINEYLEDTFPVRPLRPADPFSTARMRNWTKHSDDYLQRSIGILTHAVVMRPAALEKYDGDVETVIRVSTDPIISGWKRSVYENGLKSPHAAEAIRLILASLQQLDAVLRTGPWLVGESFTLADIAAVPAIFRLECLALDILWAEDFPTVQAWLERAKERESFRNGVLSRVTESVIADYRSRGEGVRSEINQLISGFGP